MSKLSMAIVLASGTRGLSDVVRRAEQPELLAAEGDEDDASGPAGPRTRRRAISMQRRDARGVVVRAVVDRAGAVGVEREPAPPSPRWS